jgi:hypothetical protein
MDSKSALEAVAAIRLTVPPEQLKDFDTQLAEQYGHTAEIAGPLAVQAEADETLPKKEIKCFLNASIEMSSERQLDVVRQFWEVLGCKMPELDEKQKAALNNTIERNPFMRVMPAPLLDINGCKTIAERARSAFRNQHLFAIRQNVLWTPNESYMIHAKLLKDPESIVKEGRVSYGIRYKSPDSGELLTKDRFGARLRKIGKGIEADGVTWVFPVMDVRVQSERICAPAGALHQKVEPTVVPEVLIGMQLLHRASGTPNSDYHVDFANEAIYKLDKKDVPKTPVHVTSVYWYPNDRRVVLLYWHADSQNEDFGVRAAENGL